MWWWQDAGRTAFSVLVVLGGLWLALVFTLFAAPHVAGQPVPALHTRQDLRLSGGQTGIVNVDIWFALSDGLPLRERHVISALSPAPAPINRVTYTERGQWEPTSLTPRT